MTGHTKLEHVPNIEKVLERLSLDVKLRQEKCTLMAPEVQYLGLKITKNRIEHTEENRSHCTVTLSYQCV